MTIRNVQEVIGQFRDVLIQENSELATFPEFGNLYAIFRSIAGVVIEQDAKLQTIDDTLFINTASGDFLDQKAAEFGLERKGGSRASGSIIAVGPTTILPQNTILTHQPTNIQYQVTERASLNNGRTIISVQSLRNTPEANLPAGTQLRSSVFPGVQFIVGNRFNPLTNSYEGNLVGGALRESDAVFRSRVQTLVRNLSQSTQDALTLAAVNTAGVGRATVIENTPSIGFITVYINNRNQDVFRRVQNTLNRIKPVGTAIIVKAFETVNIDISVTLSVRQNQNLNSLNSTIKNNISEYFNNVKSGDTISVEALAGQMLQNPTVYNVNITVPSSSITIESFEIPVLRNLNINYRN